MTVWVPRCSIPPAHMVRPVSLRGYALALQPSGYLRPDSCHDVAQRLREDHTS
jgi:hypothetical protein